MQPILRTLTCIFCLAPFMAKAAPGDTVIFTQRGHFYYDTTLNYAAYTPLIDREGRPYVYTASVDLGMITFDISNQMNPYPIDTITTAQLGNWKATGLAQDADTLYITTGGFQTSGERAGLSIYDVHDPANPVLLDHWDSAAYTHGTAHIVVQGDYAFLAAMDDGIIVLNIANKHDIRFVSNFVPPTTPNTGYAAHSRGLYISHDTLLDADDGGGLRIIDVSDKQNLVQTGAYINTVPTTTSGVKPFYNHVWRLGDYAYIPVDYAGMEVENVSDPANITTSSYINIWNNSGVNSWFGSDGHTNEIVYAPNENVMMVSGGDSQVLAIDPSNPSQVRVMGEWGAPNTDSLVAWGVDEYNGLVVSAYLRDVIQVFQPYYSKYGGIQLLSWNLVNDVNETAVPSNVLSFYPNPASGQCTIALPSTTDEKFTIDVFDVLGNVVMSQAADPKMKGRNATLDLSPLAAGIYTIRVTGKSVIQTGRVVKE